MNGRQVAKNKKKANKLTGRQTKWYKVEKKKETKTKPQSKRHTDERAAVIGRQINKQTNR